MCRALSESNTSTDIADGIGRRISQLRRLRGFTQQGLADRSFVSRSLIQQVETGRKSATPSLVGAVARALHADPAEIYGQPYRGSTKSTDQIHHAIDEIRRSLACVDVPPELDAPPRTLDALAAEVETLNKLTQETKYLQMGARLPAILDELSAHIHEGGSPRAWRLLNRAQSRAVGMARRHGYNDLASFGLERAAVSAVHSDDPHLGRLVNLSRTTMLMTIGAWGPGLALVRQACQGLDQDAAGSRAVYGALQLRAAVLAARAGRACEAWEYHGVAADVAGHLPPRFPDYYGLQFNSSNTAIHGAAVAVELTDHDEAIRRDLDLTCTWRREPSGLPPERRAHHEIDISRALVAAGQYEQAMRRVVRAAKIAPQMTTYHPMARETVGRLVDYRRRLPEPLRLLQRRMEL